MAQKMATAEARKECGAKADEEGVEYCMSCVDVGVVLRLLDLSH